MKKDVVVVIDKPSICERDMVSFPNKNKENITQSGLYLKLKHVVLSQAQFNSNIQKYQHTQGFLPVVWNTICSEHRCIVSYM
jgi:hypothetical protein